MSCRKYARRRGVSAMAVSLAIKKGTLKESVVRDENGQPKIADPDLADREWEANTDHSKAPAYVKQRGLEAVAAGVVSARDGMTLSEASAVEKVWRARTAELKFKEAAGELVPAKDVEQRLTDTFHTCRTRLLGIPSRARQALPHLTLADIAAIEALVREALEELGGTAGE